MDTDFAPPNAADLLPPLDALRVRLRQFVLYDDYDAGLAGRWLAREITAMLTPVCEVSAEMWKADLATRPDQLREMTLKDAGEADILIVSVSRASAPDPAVLQWLEALVPWKANRAHRGLLVVLLGAEDCEAEELTAFGECLAI